MRVPLKDLLGDMAERAETLLTFFFFFSSDFLLNFFCCWYNCIVPMGFFPWEIELPSPGKPAATESRYPSYGACWAFWCLHNPPNSDMDYGIFNVRTDVNACDCAWGCTDTLRESALKADSGRKIPCHTGKTNQHRGRAGPMLYQLNYIPTKSYGLRGAGWLSV